MLPRIHTGTMPFRPAYALRSNNWQRKMWMRPYKCKLSKTANIEIIFNFYNLTFIGCIYLMQFKDYDSTSMKSCFIPRNSGKMETHWNVILLHLTKIFLIGFAEVDNFLYKYLSFDIFCNTLRKSKLLSAYNTKISSFNGII